MVDGAVNGDVFAAFVEQVLVPPLRRGDLAVMDNLSNHKRARTRQVIESTRAQLPMSPPYSPNLNPIEMIFYRIKHLLRSRGCPLWEGMQLVLDQVTTADARNCFQHCGSSLHLDSERSGR